MEVPIRNDDPLHPDIISALWAACDQVNGLSLDLQKPTDPELRLKVPVIAFDTHTIVWGESGADFGDLSVIVLPISNLTQGRMNSVTPRELGVLLFNNDVGQEVTTHLSAAMVCSYLIEEPDARAQIDKHKTGVMACVTTSIAKFVRPKP